jgi:hypothetical protein
VGLDHAHEDVDPLGPPFLSLGEHGIGLPDARCRAEEDLQLGPIRPRFLLLHLAEQGIRVRAFERHAVTLSGILSDHLGRQEPWSDDNRQGNVNSRVAVLRRVLLSKTIAPDFRVDLNPGLEDGVNPRP